MRYDHHFCGSNSPNSGTGQFLVLFFSYQTVTVVAASSQSKLIDTYVYHFKDFHKTSSLSHSPWADSIGIGPMHHQSRAAWLKTRPPTYFLPSMSWYITLTGYPPLSATPNIFTNYNISQKATEPQVLAVVLSNYCRWWYMDWSKENVLQPQVHSTKCQRIIEAHWGMCWYITWDRVTTGGASPDEDATGTSTGRSGRSGRIV